MKSISDRKKCIIFHGMWQSPSSLNNLHRALTPYFEEIIIPNAPRTDKSWFKVSLVELLKTVFSGTINSFLPMENNIITGAEAVLANLHQSHISLNEDHRYTLIGFSQGATIASYLAFKLLPCHHLILLDGLPVADLDVVKRSTSWPSNITAIYPVSLSQEQLLLWYDFNNQAQKEGCNTCELRCLSSEHSITQEVIGLTINRIGD